MPRRRGQDFRGHHQTRHRCPPNRQAPVDKRKKCSRRQPTFQRSEQIQRKFNFFSLDNQDGRLEVEHKRNELRVHQPHSPETMVDVFGANPLQALHSISGAPAVAPGNDLQISINGGAHQSAPGAYIDSGDLTGTIPLDLAPAGSKGGDYLPRAPRSRSLPAAAIRCTRIRSPMPTHLWPGWEPRSPIHRPRWASARAKNARFAGRSASRRMK
ncbi:hypothetical protein [Mycobacterium szulgai]|uniref:hypothetical protein n=1 Tax=Mycobacterium szulgai TaxID=1787 RepID=UPI0035591E05